MTDTVLVAGPTGGITIVGQMIEVMRKVGAIAKLGTYDDNRGTRFNFRGVDDVINAVGPILREVGVLPVPVLETIERRDTHTGAGHATKEVSVIVQLRVYAADGSYIQYRVPGENLSRSDKGTAAAMSVAYRVLWLQALAIPTDDPDPDSQYLTRDGRGEMSPAQVGMLHEALSGLPPLAELPKLWAIVQDHAAADRASTWFHNPENPMTWYEAFGYHLAQRFNAIQTPDDWKAAKAEIAQLGPDHGLTWKYQGVDPGARFSQRAKDILQLEQETARVFDARIAEAATLEDLGVVIGELGEAHREHKIHEPRYSDLLAFATQRSVKLEEKTTEQPDEAAAGVAETVQADVEAAGTVDPWEQSARDPGVPEEQALAQTADWPPVTAPAVPQEPAQAAAAYLAEDAAQVVANVVPQEPAMSATERLQVETYHWLAKIIAEAKPEQVPALTADIDGNFERGKLTISQRDQLAEQVRERLAKPAQPAAEPQPAPAESGPDPDQDPYGAMAFAIAHAQTEEALDAIKVAVDDMTTARPAKLTPKQNERLFARVSARRTEIRRAAKAAKPSLEEMP